MAGLPSESVDLVVTSPPFPLTFRKKKPYSSVGEERFVEWFLAYADERRRLLKKTGSFVVDLAFCAVLDPPADWVAHAEGRSWWAEYGKPYKDSHTRLNDAVAAARREG